MNKFALWMENNDKKQAGTAEKLGITQSTLHMILRKNRMPSLIVAYRIEEYTKGDITLYDWIEEWLEREREATIVMKGKKAKKKIENNF